MVLAASTFGFHVSAQYLYIWPLKIFERERSVWVCLCLHVGLECVARRGFVKPDEHSSISYKFILVR